MRFWALSGCMIMVCCDMNCQGSSSSAVGVNPPRRILEFELRIDETVHFEGHVEVEVVGSKGTSATVLDSMAKSSTAGTLVYQRKDAILGTEKLYVVVDPQSEDAQVFDLRHCEGSAQEEWSAWRRPSYMDSSRDPGWNALTGGGEVFRNASIPEKSFELRFRVLPDDK